MAKVKILAGKVPAAVKELMVDEGLTVEQAMRVAAKECNFTFTTEMYKIGSKEMLDVPSLNGKELCRRDGKVIVEVFWSKPVSSGDVILIVPKIKGN